MDISKTLKKILVCGASLVMVASLGSGINNVSAHRVHHYRNRTARVYRRHGHHYNKAKNRSSKSYKLVEHYLKLAQEYVAKTKKPYKSNKIVKSMNGLTHSQKRHFLNEFNRINKNAKHNKRNKRAKSYRRTTKKHLKRVHKSHRVGKKSRKRSGSVVDELEKGSGKKGARHAINHNHNNNEANKSASDTNDDSDDSDNYGANVIALAGKADDITNKDEANYQKQQDAKENAEEDAEEKADDAWNKKMESETPVVNVVDNDPYHHEAPSSAHTFYDPSDYDYAMAVDYPDGTEESYDGFDSGAYGPNSLRNYSGYQKFAKTHPQEAYNWLLHPSNYSGVDDGEEASVGHNYSPVGNGIPYQY